MVEAVDIIPAGLRAVRPWRHRASARVTGRELSPQVAHIWDLVGDKIVRFQQYTDTWLFAEATGMIPFTK